MSVSFSGGVITSEIAGTTAQRDLGLMNRTTLGADAGIMFIFGVDRGPSSPGFWMKDTSIPISIAFIDSTKRVVSVQDMAPFTLDDHRPSATYRYALEVNRGWFTTHNIVVGALATFAIPAGTVWDP